MKHLTTILLLCLIFGCQNLLDDQLEMTDGEIKTKEQRPPQEIMDDIQENLRIAQTAMYSSGHEAWRGNLLTSGQISQNIGTTFSANPGFSYNSSFHGETFYLILNQILPSIEKGLYETEGIEELEYIHSIFRIVKVVNLLRLTEIYGDIPYVKNCRDYYHDGLYLLEYDSQEKVLEYMVEDLIESRNKIGILDKSTLKYTDYYNTNSSSQFRYTKLANSLLIKIGLMLSEANPSRGAEVFKLGYENFYGYIKSWDDAPYIEHSDDYNPWSDKVNGTGVAIQGRVGGFSETFISDVALKYMQGNFDPRLFRIVAHYDRSYGTADAISNPFSLYRNFDPFAKAEDSGDFKKVHYRGVRMGNSQEVPTLFHNAETNEDQLAFKYYSVFGDNYSNYHFIEQGQLLTLAGINPATFNATTPSLVIGADEVSYLVAEANVLPEYGINDVDAFKNALTLSQTKYREMNFPGDFFEMSYSNLYKHQTNSNYNLESAKIEYVDRLLKKYNEATDKRDLIVTEHWISLIPNGYSSFSLVNRTGGPSFLKSFISNDERTHSVKIFDKDPIMYSSAIGIGTKEIELFHSSEDNFERPYRFPYSSDELEKNTQNVTEAIQNQGGYLPLNTLMNLKQYYSKKDE
ncbi:SusD/RagB family nutrient-binding outer membrane lipoprotein [Flammeovirga yaeyamensis]|uniref:SusD/RagB family nutrient-binding outer membrane lipoprotein n=1 Tax=Flammeovirga yaeyamensis TaxID=367791 RepID=A0AAX1NA20_9BACT|nr:SusD/RagB family nutrient-binding outer membrane lipoprotein [Flammeovirga yaeyamensis]MBB3699200.1 hypothetical protein [Flammeovirga yaeyamensis]NMF35536.1 SusD/RagB family nutrient-binding outer membrane lipoprotein [Flammeovirga yaeyamensis]QWG04395.1 SusD/RagB family nutrient-binding outer membrane lipoprotein [Flammeovirga yaeyamensis]